MIKWNKEKNYCLFFLSSRLNPAFAIGVNITFITVIFNIFIIVTSIRKCLSWLIYAITNMNLLYISGQPAGWCDYSWVSDRRAVEIRNGILCSIFGV